MKIFLRIFAAVILLSWGVGVTSAATGDLRNWLDTLNNNIPFWYAPTQKISVFSIAPDKIVIQSPVIMDDFGNTIKKYTVMYSQYPLSQILENTALLDQAKEKTFDFTTMGTGITMELNMTTDTILPVSVYYLSVIPKDQNGILWEISNEIRFKLATQTYGEGNLTTSASSHAAAGADMSLANITHTITRNIASLRWTAVDGSDKIDIFLLDPISQTFQRLASVNMAAERYDFPLRRNGEYILNFMPNNWGTEYRYSFVANGIIAPVWGTSSSNSSTPVIKNIPATGPKENIMIVLALSLVAYLIYRKMTAKSKH